MIILEKPFVSTPLVEYLETSQIPVLHNEMAELLKQQGHRLNLLDDQQFVEKYQETKKLYAVSENALVWLYAQLPRYASFAFGAETLGRLPQRGRVYRPQQS